MYHSRGMSVTLAPLAISDFVWILPKLIYDTIGEYKASTNQQNPPTAQVKVNRLVKEGKLP